MTRKTILLVVAVAIAAMGATLVLVYVKGHTGTAVAGAPQGQQVKVLTATATIDAGETAGAAQAAGKLALATVPAASVVAGAVTSIDSMDNMVALAPIYPGEQILAPMFGTSATSHQALTVPNGKVAVSVELTDPGRVAGFVTPGSHVSIFLSYKGASMATNSSFTRVIVPDAEVLAVGPTTMLTGTSAASTAANNSDVSATILTIALSQLDADKTLYAADQGTVSFGLLGQGAPKASDPGVSLKDVS